jgi:sugar/nucleoside kinase (ribokinase family)
MRPRLEAPIHLGGDPVVNHATDGPFLTQPIPGREPKVATYGRRATLDVMKTPSDPDALHEDGLTIRPGEKQRFTLVNSSAGGNEVNTGLDLARQGVPTTIYTVAGKDPIGAAIKAELVKATKNPDTNLKVKVRRHGESRMSTIIFNPGEDRRIMSASPGDKMADTGVRFENLRKTVKKHDYFYFTYMGQGFGEVVQEIKNYNEDQKNINKPKKRYSMSLNSVDFSELGPHHFEAINGADILFTNKDEAQTITAAATHLEFNEEYYSSLYDTTYAVKDIDEANEDAFMANEATKANKALIDKDTFILLHKVKALGVNWGSVSDGGNGAYLIDENSTILHIAPFNKHLSQDERAVINTLGAGDAYASGVIAARARGQSAEEAVRQGAIMSDKTIKVVGPHDGSTNVDDMEYTSWRFLGNFRTTTVFEKPYTEAITSDALPTVSTGYPFTVNQQPRVAA